MNALLCIRKRDIDWENQLILIRGETEKTHKEFVVPITEGLVPHLSRLLQEADRAGFADDDQLFNVNRFSPHYKSKVMNSDQVEAMYRKLTETVGVRMTPHRFRHTLATDLMKAPERNIHLTKCLLNHSNIQTTMSYIEADYDLCVPCCMLKPGPRRAGECQEGGLQRLPASLCQTEAMRPTSRSSE